MLTFLVDELRIRADKSDDPVGLRRAFLHAQHPTYHVNKHIFERPLSCEFDTVSIVYRFCVFRSICVYFVESYKVLLVVGR